MHGRVSCCEKLLSSGRASMLPEEALSSSPARASCGFFARQGLAAASPHELAPRAGRYNLRSSKPTTCCGSPELLMRRGKEIAMEQPRRLGARPASGPLPLRRPRAPPPRSIRPAAGSTRSRPIRRPDHQPRVASCLSCGREEDDREEHTFIRRLGARPAFGLPPPRWPRSVRPTAQTTNQAPPLPCPVVAGRIIKTAGSFM
ncbi:hypothetical protein VPH35_131175 [Triticum aestivum]